MKERKLQYNLLNKKSGKLKIINFLGKIKENSNDNYWEAECECGTRINVTSYRFKSGKTKSCGCLFRELASQRAYNLPHRLKDGEASLNQLYRNYKNNAIKRKLEFKLSINDFQLITKQNCFYCNVEPKQKVNLKVKNGDYIHNGIDRLDPNLGYIKSNCVPCCSNCNYAKMEQNLDDFKILITNIYNHFIKEKE